MPPSRGAFFREQVAAAAICDNAHVLMLRTEDESSSRTCFDVYESMGLEIIDITPPVSGSHFSDTVKRRLLWLRGLSLAFSKWGRPDLIHCQDMSSFYAAPTAKLLGIPYVVSQYWSGFERRLLDKRTKIKCRKAFNSAKLILSSDRHGKNSLRRYGIKGDIRWIPNSFDPEIFRPAEVIQRRSGLLHASNFSQNNRVEDIIEAFRRILLVHPDAVLNLVGSGGWEGDLKKIASEKLPANSFIFHGFLKKKQRAEMMRASSGFVCPSVKGTHSCDLMEAIACGCPALATEAACKTIAVHSDDVLSVKPGDIDELSRGMILLLQGTHGINTKKAAESISARLSRPQVGKLIHKAHLDALNLHE